MMNRRSLIVEAIPISIIW